MSAETHVVTNWRDLAAAIFSATLRSGVTADPAGTIKIEWRDGGTRLVHIEIDLDLIGGEKDK